MPRLNAHDQAALHDTPDYYEHPYFQERRQALEAARVRARRVVGRIARVADVDALRGERYLDIGCDTGLFALSLAAELGVAPAGLDVSSRAVSESRNNGLDAHQADLAEAPNHLSGLAVITAIDLIEHVANPYDFLTEAHQRLRPGGLLYFETPNPRSTVYLAGRILGGLSGARPRSIFKRLFPPQHAQYFSLPGLSTLAERCGYDVLLVEKQHLPQDTLAASPAVKLAVHILQTADRAVGEPILLCGLLRKI